MVSEEFFLGVQHDRWPGKAVSPPTGSPGPVGSPQHTCPAAVTMEPETALHMEAKV